MKTEILIALFLGLLGIAFLWHIARPCTYRSRKNGIRYYLIRRVQLVGEEKEPVELFYFQQQKTPDVLRSWPKGYTITEKATGLPVLTPTPSAQ